MERWKSLLYAKEMQANPNTLQSLVQAGLSPAQAIVCATKGQKSGLPDFFHDGKVTLFDPTASLALLFLSRSRTVFQLCETVFNRPSSSIPDFAPAQAQMS